MTEIEAKFLVEDPRCLGRVFAALREQGWEMFERGTREIEDRYFDTPDLQLQRAGWAYRWREEQGHRKIGLRALTAPQGYLHAREGFEQTVTEFPGAEQGESGPVLTRLRELADLRRLIPLFHVTNRRRVFDVQGAGALRAELAVDQVTIVACDKPARQAPGTLGFQEVELELVQGQPADLALVADVLAQDGELLPARQSKFERGLLVMGRARARELLHAGEPLAPRSSAWKLVHRCLLRNFSVMLEEMPKAWEGLDPEGVHQMRVATRRLRAALRAFRRLLPAEETSRLSGEIGWIAGVLGEVRDLDVYRTNLDRYAAWLPATDTAELDVYYRYLASQWQQARKGLIEALASGRYRQLESDFRVFLGTIRSDDLQANTPLTVHQVAIAMLRQQLRKVRQSGRKLRDDSPARKFHRLRIQSKRMRYLLEFFLPAYGRPLREVIAPLKELQDVLGDLQDTAVATARVRAFADQLPLRSRHRPLLLVLGQLIQIQSAEGTQLRRGFAAVWERFDRKGLWKSLHQALQAAEAQA